MANGELLKDLENDGPTPLAGVCARWVRPGKAWSSAILGSNLDRMSGGSGPGEAGQWGREYTGCGRCRRDEATGFGDRD